MVSSTAAPDLSLLDPCLVHLLASQRLQQLFKDEKTTGVSLSQSNHAHLNSINGVRSFLSPKPAKPVLTAGNALQLFVNVHPINSSVCIYMYILIRSFVKVCVCWFGCTGGFGSHYLCGHLAHKQYTK